MSFATSVLSRACGRDPNQDASSFLEQGDSMCWVLADGAGGNGGGETASRLAVEAVLDSFRRNPRCAADALASHIAAAQRAVLDEQRAQPQLKDMRATIVLLVSDGRKAIWAHLGDARLYHFENGAVAAQTEDHGVPVPSRDREPAMAAAVALGMAGDPKPAILKKPITLHRGDAFLLATDGFWGLLNETEMEADLAKSHQPGEWLHQLEGRLAPRALADHDNYTGVGVTFTSQTAPEPGAGNKPRSRTGPPLLLSLIALFVLAVGTAGAAAAWRFPGWFQLVRQFAATTTRYSSIDELPRGVVYTVNAHRSYRSLKQAIEAAGDGETLWIGPGVFEDAPPVIAKRIRLIGSSQPRTTVVMHLYPLELRDPVLAIENLHIISSPGVLAALALGGEFQGVVRNVRVQASTRVALHITGNALPTLEGTTLVPISRARCYENDSPRWKAELPDGNVCLPPYNPGAK